MSTWKEFRNELVKNNYDVTIIIKCNEQIDYSLYDLSNKSFINILSVKVLVVTYIFISSLTLI